MEGEVTNLRRINRAVLMRGVRGPRFRGDEKDFGSSVAPPIFAPSNEIQSAHTSSFNLSKLVSR